jgi:hypothetical protein
MFRTKSRVSDDIENEKMSGGNWTWIWMFRSLVRNPGVLPRCCSDTIDKGRVSRAEIGGRKELRVDGSVQDDLDNMQR